VLEQLAAAVGGDSSDDIYFYCMTVVESTVLVFGSCES